MEGLNMLGESPGARYRKKRTMSLSVDSFPPLGQRLPRVTRERRHSITEALNRRRSKSKQGAMTPGSMKTRVLAPPPGFGQKLGPLKRVSSFGKLRARKSTPSQNKRLVEEVSKLFVRDATNLRRGKHWNQHINNAFSRMEVRASLPSNVYQRKSSTVQNGYKTSRSRPSLPVTFYQPPSDNDSSDDESKPNGRIPRPVANGHHHHHHPEVKEDCSYTSYIRPDEKASWLSSILILATVLLPCFVQCTYQVVHESLRWGLVIVVAVVLAVLSIPIVPVLLVLLPFLVIGGLGLLTAFVAIGRLKSIMFGSKDNFKHL